MCQLRTVSTMKPEKTTIHLFASRYENYQQATLSWTLSEAFLGCQKNGSGLHLVKLRFFFFKRRFKFDMLLHTSTKKIAGKPTSNVSFEFDPTLNTFTFLLHSTAVGITWQHENASEKLNWTDLGPLCHKILWQLAKKEYQEIAIFLEIIQIKKWINQRILLS